MSDEDIREDAEATEPSEAAACELEGEGAKEVAAESVADADVAGEEAEADEATEADDAAGGPSCGEELSDDYELVELELSEDDIVRYLEDDEGNQIGFVVIEDGEECEYLYVEEDDDDSDELDCDPEAVAARDGGLGITRDGVQAATDDMNAIFKDGVKVAAEMKGAFDDIKSALDFSSFLK